MAFESMVELCEGRLAAFTIAPGFPDRCKDERVATGFSSFDELLSTCSDDSHVEVVDTPRGIRGESGVLESRTDSSAESNSCGSQEWAEVFELNDKKSMSAKLKEINSNRSGRSRKRLPSLLSKLVSRWNQKCEQ
uniref:Uncharacterized protein n=1 Tax=Timspurckia oligopyrenoides TaxID=708627 RepID=A0A6T6LGU8_9RHOD|mmetsp:Transcript_11265/g.20362  ORF Transcript_11265/g.20362 Transcript_11265/m.20362 type:complete len:135 (+) Transcript_11265:752-1156(+)